MLMAHVALFTGITELYRACLQLKCVEKSLRMYVVSDRSYSIENQGCEQNGSWINNGRDPWEILKVLWYFWQHDTILRKFSLLHPECEEDTAVDKGEEQVYISL